MITKHYQFTEADQITIGSDVHPSAGPLVSLRQYAGSCHFQFSMTPAQAREMAAALVKHADELEAVEVAA